MSDTPTPGEANSTALTQLGGQTRPSRALEAFPNRCPDRFYKVTLETEEFTCLCPKTGQPDFAALTIEYVPDQKVVESKSLKLYLWSFRDEGVFHEHLTNRMLDDLVAAVAPHWMRVTGRFNIRGGIAITVSAEHRRTEAARAAVLD